MSFGLQKENRPFLKKKGLKRSPCAARLAEKLESRRKRGQKRDRKRPANLAGLVFSFVIGDMHEALGLCAIYFQKIHPYGKHMLPRVCIALLFR